MAPDAPQAPLASAEPRRRSTVRIVKPRPYWRHVMLTLSVVLAGGLAVVGIWWMGKPDHSPPARQRSLEEITYHWRCVSGHAFTAAGSMQQRPCPTCREQSYVVDVYACPEHGRFEAAVRFGPDARTGKPVATHLRLKGQSWVPFDAGLTCPKCGKKMMRASVEQSRQQD